MGRVAIPGSRHDEHRAEPIAFANAGSAYSSRIWRYWLGVAALIVMPDCTKTSIQFASCALKVKLWEAVMCAVAAVERLSHPRG